MSQLHPIFDFARLTFAQCLMIGLGSCICPKGPESIAEGTWTVLNAEELPIQIDAVVVDGDVMTITYVDEAGDPQWVTYVVDE